MVFTAEDRHLTKC